MIIERMIGKVMVSVQGKAGDVELVFTDSDGGNHAFWHNQDGGEQVYIEAICGDLQDLLHSPIVQAEESTKKADDGMADSATWTFYLFSTPKGSVTIRWYGASNGYYSESVGYSYAPKSKG